MSEAKKKKRRKLKPVVKKIIFGTIGVIFVTYAFITIYFMAVLQSSYKYAPPTQQEAEQIRSNPISNWFFGKYIIEENEGE